jgi:hypothetical protein
LKSGRSEKLKAIVSERHNLKALSAIIITFTAMSLGVKDRHAMKHQKQKPIIKTE